MTELNKSILYNNAQELYVVGKSNIQACDRIISVMKDAQMTYNPVIVYGPTGVGKTHLLFAVVNALKLPEVAFINASDIISDYVTFIKNKKKDTNQPDIKSAIVAKFAGYNTVIIDSLHALIGKAGMQDAFCEIIRELIDCKKQIIIVTDTVLSEYDVLSKELDNNFKKTLLCTIEKPDNDLMRNIINLHAERGGISLDEEAAEWLSEQAESVPYIIGAVKKISVVYEQKKDISLADVKKILKEK